MPYKDLEKRKKYHQQYSKTHKRKQPECRSITCSCGCGTELMELDDYHRKRRYVSGHNQRGAVADRELIRKRLYRRAMSGVESRVLHIIQKFSLPFRFVGNGDYFIGRKNPDFISTNNDKVVVEVFYRKHKDEFANGGFERWRGERLRVFSESGWRTVFIESHDVREDKVVLALTGGGAYGTR